MQETRPENSPQDADIPSVLDDISVLQALAENSTEILAVLDTSGQYIYTSPSVETTLGWSPNELVGCLGVDIVHPDDQARVGAALAGLQEPPHNPTTLRFLFRKQDGGSRLMESTIRLLIRPNKPSLMIAHSRDITDQENTGKALQDSEERYRQLIENSPDAVIAHTQGVIVYANTAAADLFGAESPEAFVGQKVAVIIHPDDLLGMRERVQKALTQGRHAPLREERMVKLNGDEIWVEAKGVHTVINGEPSIQAVIRNVTQRRNAMLAEQRRAEATRMLYEIASQADLDIEHQLLKALELTSSLLGLESGLISECDETTCFVAYHYGPAHTEGKGKRYPLEQTYCAIPMQADDVVAIADLTNSAHAEHPAVQNMPQQSYIGMPIEVSGDKRGVLGFSGTKPRSQSFDDVDKDTLRMMARWVEFALERKHASQALEAVNDDLSRSNEELQQFAYIASHDLKEPLRAVTTYLQLLGRRHRDQLNDEALEFMDFAITGAKRMQNLIQDLLEFSRVGTYSKDAASISLDSIVDQALSNLAGPVQASAASITADKLPDVIGHEGLLLQLIENLVGNAIKYRRPDVAPKIHISAHPQPGQTRINFTDNGVGVAPEHRERIFQMFRRLHTHEQYEGTGIGLAIAKRIVERHGGEIGVTDAPTGGSCFFFILPTTGV